MTTNYIILPITYFRREIGRRVCCRTLRITDARDNVSMMSGERARGVVGLKVDKNYADIIYG